MKDSPSCRDKSQRVYASKGIAGSGQDLPKPEWLKIRLSPGCCFNETKSIVQEYKLSTVCEEANCPNMNECWQKKHATFMILGAICTRSCAFCDVTTGKPGPLDDEEPLKVAQAVRAMGLRHVVITSVDRDDLPDGGALHFAKCISAVREINPHTTIEVLTPDFRNKNNALEVVVDAVPDVYNHNIETVPRLYASIRPSARYFHSLNLLYRVKQFNCKIPTKSGIIVGMGESAAEIAQVLDDLRAAEVDFVTIGQYLRPSKNHWPVDRYVTPGEFASYKAIAIAKGFKMVASGPFVRSSYHAEEDFLSLRQNLIAGQQN